VEDVVHTWREDHSTPVVHVLLIALAAVIIPVHVLLHKVVAGHIIGAVGVVGQVQAVAVLSIKPVVVQCALALTGRG